MEPEDEDLVHLPVYKDGVLIADGWVTRSEFEMLKMHQAMADANTQEIKELEDMLKEGTNG